MSTVPERRQAAEVPASATSAWGHVVGFGLLLTVVVFLPTWGEPFTIPKVALATVTALAAAPLLWVRRQWFAASPWPVGLAGAFVVLALASLAFSGAPVLGSLWGEWARRSGFVFILVLALMFAIGSVLTRPEIRTALSWLVWAGVPATAYGLIQLVGADPFPWTDVGWVVSTFGNPNFAAAGLSMLALLTAGLAAVGGYRAVWRLLMTPLAALEALVALATGSSVAIFALAAGALLGLLAWVLWSPAPRRHLLAAGILVLGLVGAALTALGLLGLGPLVAAVSPDTLQFRRWYWGAGLRMAMGHPVLGVGPDGFGRFYGEYRSSEAAKMYTLGVNNSHDVPLQWAATLGIPAALVYVALVLLVAALVLRRLWLHGPQTSPLVVPLLAVWGAYQVQSLVSIDETGVALMGWFTMGALLAVTKPDPAAPPPTSAPTWVAAGVLGLVGLLVWIPPMLASNSSRTVVQGTTEADVLQAVSLVDGSTLPCGGALPVARWMTSVAPSELTVEPVFSFAERDDRCYGMVNAAADFAIQTGQAERAVALADQAVAIDPLNYSTWLLLARAADLAGDSASAQAAVDRAAGLSPGNGDVAAIAEQLGLALPGAP